MSPERRQHRPEGPTESRAGPSGDPDSRCPSPTAGVTLLSGVAVAVALAGVAVAVALACVAVAGSAGAAFPAGQNGDPPELSQGERINDTAVELAFTDDSGVALDSITRSEFLLSAGEIDHLSVRRAGTDAAVVMVLADPIDEDELTVAVRDASEIQDVQGNRIDTGGFVGVTVGGMDGVPPSLRRLEAPDRASDAIEYRLVFDEPVEAFEATLSGPRDRQLDRDDFERVRGTQYTLTYEPPVDGEYVFELGGATDAAGNTDTFAHTASTEVETADVQAVAAVDISASGGLNFTFDAGRSEGRAVAYLWEFGDGATATGERVTHTFAPGNYTVRLEVIDEFGNVGRDRITLDLTGNRTAGFAPGGGSGPVSVERSGSPLPGSAQVTVTEARTGEPVIVRPDPVGQPVIATERFSLAELTVTPAENGSFGVGLDAVGAGSERLSAAGEAAGGEVIAGFVARPTVPDEALSGVTLRFSVARDRIEASDVEPEAVTLYRNENENGNGSWEAGSTTVRSIGRDRVSFESEVAGFSRFAVVAVTGEDGADDQDQDQDADADTAVGNQTDSATGTGSDPDEDSADADGTTGGTEQRQFRVTNVTLNETSIEPGDVVDIDAEIVNEGDQPADYLAALSLNGTVVESREVLRIPPNGESIPVTFSQQINETGRAALAINGTAAPELTVSEDGGGGLLGFLPLGFLPWGLLRTGLLFVVAPLTVVGLLLKGVASYLGY